MGYIEIFEMDSNGAGWKNLDDVFNKAQIEVRVPKSFIQIAK
jgi:hypothetical protein